MATLSKKKIGRSMQSTTHRSNHDVPPAKEEVGGEEEEPFVASRHDDDVHALFNN